MWFRTLFDSLKPRSARERRPRRDDPRAQSAVCRLGVEALGDRIVPASLSVGSAVLVEGNAGSHYAEVRVRLDAPTNKTVTVNHGTANGMAASGSDYQAVSGKLTFAPGETSKTIRVAVKGDRLPEVNENFFVKLSGAKNARIANGQGVVTIVDDEPRISINGATFVYEGNSDRTLFTFTVSLSAAYDEAVTVNYATADASATTSDNDYLAAFGTLSFAPGETTRTITIEVIGDSTIEPVETFLVNFNNASTNALVLSGQTLGYVLDDDMYALPPPPEDDCNWGPYGCQ